MTAKWSTGSIFMTAASAALCAALAAFTLSRLTNMGVSRGTADQASSFGATLQPVTRT
jgi:AAHS family 4-hydroxybenzoate transporter-like MFS transporter